MLDSVRIPGPSTLSNQEWRRQRPCERDGLALPARIQAALHKKTQNQCEVTAASCMSAERTPRLSTLRLEKGQYILIRAFGDDWRTALEAPTTHIP